MVTAKMWKISSPHLPANQELMGRKKQVRNGKNHGSSSEGYSSVQFRHNRHFAKSIWRWAHHHRRQTNFLPAFLPSFSSMLSYPTNDAVEENDDDNDILNVNKQLMWLNNNYKFHQHLQRVRTRGNVSERCTVVSKSKLDDDNHYHHSSSFLKN